MQLALVRNAHVIMTVPIRTTHWVYSEIGTRRVTGGVVTLHYKNDIKLENTKASV